jgi:KamA family protein
LWYPQGMEPAPTNELSWQSEWAHNLRSAEDLAACGLIAPDRRHAVDRVLKKFKFSLPRYYARLIDPRDPHCPIRLQAIPSPEELDVAPGWDPDPLADLSHQPAPSITHRYRNRALLHLTPNCSLYCRYCFRKSLLNELRSELFGNSLADSLAYVAAHPELEELILSGGDPLMLGDSALGRVLDDLAAVPHLKRIRIHTRVPVTFPMRITDALAKELGRCRLPIVVVVHFNHPRELTDEATEACARLKQVSAAVLNQSVLLKGVNDSAETLRELSEGLFDRGILPYYLHHPDKASGTGHFGISPEAGLAIHNALRERVSGYLVPRYVVDEPGIPYKRSLESRP